MHAVVLGRHPHAFGSAIKKACSGAGMSHTAALILGWQTLKQWGWDDTHSYIGAGITHMLPEVLG